MPPNFVPTVTEQKPKKKNKRKNKPKSKEEDLEADKATEEVKPSEALNGKAPEFVKEE